MAKITEENITTALEVKEPISLEDTTKKQHPGKHFFKKGESGNPAGRPKDAISFKTKWLRFIDKIAEQNNLTPDEVDKQMLTVAYKQMQSGDFRYWHDIQDRVYGSAVSKVELDAHLSIDEIIKRLDK